MGNATRKQYSPEQKVQIVLELLKEEKSLSQLASEHGIHHSQILRWKKQALWRAFPERSLRTTRAMRSKWPVNGRWRLSTRRLVL